MDNKNIQQNLNYIQENLNYVQEILETPGWKIYQNKTKDVADFVINCLCRKETSLEDIRYYQGLYDGIKRALKILPNLVQEWKKILDESKSWVATVNSEER
jgi:hypothetical protein